MTQDKVIELAKKAGGDDAGKGAMWLMTGSELQRFAELVRNEVLEDASVKCENEWSSVIRGCGRVTWGDASEISDDLAKELRNMK